MSCLGSYLVETNLITCSAGESMEKLTRSASEIIVTIMFSAALRK